MALAALLCLFAPPLGSIAVAEPAVDEPLDFDIPAQPISAALRAYARQANLQLLVLTDGLEAVQSNAVIGSFEAGDALRSLLDGTGLQAEHRSDSTVAIKRVTESANRSDNSTQNGGHHFFDDNEYAQQIGQADSDKQYLGHLDETGELSRKLEEIVVTGSRIRGAQSASPIITITRQEIERTGFATVEELVDHLPQNFGAGASQDGFTDRGRATAVGGAVADFAGGTSINLRGLGTGATLVLINGRRINAGGLEAQFVDVSSIPLSAIERVEVLTDGASAIYGADAIAGVVNFILRPDYEGAHSRLRLASDTGTNTSETLIAQTLGKAWRRGNALLSYEFYNHDNLANSDRHFAASSDLRRFGGDDFRLLGGNPANIIAGAQQFAIPSGQNGTSLTADDFDPATSLNLHDVRAVEDFLPEQKRHTAMMSLTHSVSDNFEVFAQARYSIRDHTVRADRALLDLIVPNSNPFFVDPTGGGLSSVSVDNYSPVADFGPRIIKASTDTYGSTLGLNFNLGSAWQGELAGTYSKESSISYSGLEVNQVRISAAAAESDPDSAFNPFGDGSHTHSPVLETLLVEGDRDAAKNVLWAINTDFEGNIFAIGSRDVRAAVGLEYRNEAIASEFIQGSERGAAVFTPGLDRSRRVFAAYAEAFLPLVGGDNPIPGMRRLELSIAGRYENYSDFGSSIDPKIGVVWSPHRSLDLRATFGTSFKAPLLSDLDVSNLSDNRFIYFPQPALFPVPPIILLGGNETLDAETATTWTAGFKLSPARVEGLTVDLTYSRIEFDDRVRRSFGDLRRTFDPQFSRIQNFDPTPEEITAVVNDPRWDEAFGVSAADVLSGAAPVGAIIDARTQNIARTRVTGTELQLLYALRADAGDLSLGLNGSYMFDFKQAELNTQPAIEEVDTIGRPVDFRARGTISWSTDSWDLSTFVNFTDDYTDNVSDPERGIGSWTTVDAQISYYTRERPSNSWLHNLRTSLSLQNVLDEDPPFANSVGGLGYDSVNANGRGRFVALQVAKDW
jgi:outer membrane receptor protein involved in Fe transport